jgi:hypothetical protein
MANDGGNTGSDILLANVHDSGAIGTCVDQERFAAKDGNEDAKVGSGCHGRRDCDCLGDVSKYTNNGV